MKKCPVCSYTNSGEPVVCGICGASLEAVPVIAPPPGLPKYSHGLKAGLLLLFLFGGAFFYLSGRQASPAQSCQEEDGFAYGGVHFSLETMKRLRFLSTEEKRKVVPLLYSPDSETAVSAARLLGAWARFSAEREIKDDFFKELVKCSLSCGGGARRQAALETGLCAAYGLDPRPYGPGIGKSAAELIRAGDEEYNAAGFFLASMCGIEDFTPEMKAVVAAAPSAYLRLHAACALSRLGQEEGDRYLFSVIPVRGDPRAAEAVSCLAYSPSVRAAEFLKKAASGVYGEGLTGHARVSLALRGQLIANK